MTFLEMRDWTGFAFTVASVPLSILLFCLSRPRPRTAERRWSLEIGSLIKVTSERRETDVRS